MDLTEHQLCSRTVISSNLSPVSPFSDYKTGHWLLQTKIVHDLVHDGTWTSISPHDHTCTDTTVSEYHACNTIDKTTYE